MGKQSGVREDDRIAEKRPKVHGKLQHQVLRDEGDAFDTSHVRIEDSKFWKENPEYQERGVDNKVIKETSMDERDSNIIAEQIQKQKDRVEKYRLDGKEEVGSAISTPQIKGQKSKIGDMDQEKPEDVECEDGDCPDQEMFAKVSGSPWDQTKDFLWYGDFSGTLWENAWRWVLEDNAMFNNIIIVDNLDDSTIDDGPRQKYWGGMIGSNFQTLFEDKLWRVDKDYEMSGKIQGKMCHWNHITHFKTDYVESDGVKFIRLNGFNNDWGCLIWHLRDNDLVETMPILLWGDTSIGHTFAEGFERVHAYQSDDGDAREEVQEYIESFTHQDPLIIINTDTSDGPILDWSNIDSRHIMMDIGARDTPSPFLKAAEENGNEIVDGYGYYCYKMMTTFNDILWNKAYKHIDVKRLTAYLKELVEHNGNQTN